VLAYPIAFYMAKVASPRTRGSWRVAVLMPLWASYLIKAYSWRLILSEDGVLDWASSRSALEARASVTWRSG
jgi:putative spermidine/putrescine transport system permease protein